MQAPDGKEYFGIIMGWEAAQELFQFLMQRYPDLPPYTRNVVNTIGEALEAHDKRRS